ncbi:MAG: 4'-phosphopantetheinyl transferase superfamily protein [Streptosporangiaceae bacterium]
MADSSRPDLPDGTADVWWAHKLDASDRHAGLLDDTERQRLERYRSEEDRQRFLTGCALAKTVLARYTGQPAAGIHFDRTCGQCGRPHGKPVLAGGGPAHSVSHSGDLVAVAVARDPVGVDVEQLDSRRQAAGNVSDPDALARMVLSGAERAALAAIRPSGRAREFLVAWTRKEAVTKATGDGLSVAFSDVVVAADHGPPRVLSWPYPRDPAQVSLRDLETEPGYVAALAIIGRCEAVRPQNGSALLAAA